MKPRSWLLLSAFLLTGIAHLPSSLRAGPLPIGADPERRCAILDSLRWGLAPARESPSSARLPARPWSIPAGPSALADSSLGGDDLWWDGFWPSGTCGPIGRFGHNDVSSMIVYQGQLIVAGQFGFVDGIRVPGIGAWDGRRWQAFSERPPFYEGVINSLYLFRDRLIAGGTAMTYRGDSVFVAEWDGVTWRPFAPGLTSGFGFVSIHSLATYGEDLVAAGYFTRASGAPTPGVARWDGSAWQPMGADSLHGEFSGVFDLAEYQGSLYAGGFLQLQEGDSTVSVMRWEQGRWDHVPGAPAGRFGGFCVHEDQLLVGGRFDEVGGHPATGLASWDGSYWRPFGNGAGISSARSVISQIVPHDGQLFVAGDFDSIGGVAARGVAVWDGVTWHPMGSGIDTDQLQTGLANFDGRWFVGGGGFFANGSANIATWDGVRWGPIQPRGIKLVGRPTAFLPQEDGLLVAGPFATPPDGDVRYRIGRWDGSSWSYVGPPFDGSADALAAFHGSLVISGDFDSIAGVPVHFVAQLEGGEWKPMGGGMSYPVGNLAVYKDRLIAGGLFWRADGRVVHRIAQWDGARWSELGAGVSGGDWPKVLGMQIYKGRLIVVGNFTQAGDVPAQGVAAWDGERWESAGANFDFERGEPWVYQVALCNDKLIVAGEISGVAQQATTTFAEWDGGAWRPLDSEIQGSISCLGTYDGRLVAGGWFDSGHTWPDSTYVLTYDGTRWFRMGAGVWSGNRSLYMFPPVTAMAAWNGDLYIGGYFNAAGDRPSPHIARWDGSSFRGRTRGLSLSVGPNPSAGDWNVSWTQTRPGPIRIRIFDIRGRLMARIAKDDYAPGPQVVPLGGPATDLPSGLYLIRLDTPGGSANGKLLKVR